MTQVTDSEIHLAAYDPSWPSLFEAERGKLLEILAPWLAGPVEHIGSTAVPAMIAKPVVDIMAGVENLAASRDAIAAAGRLGYQYAPYRTDVMHWFCKPHFSFRTHHLHLVPVRSRLWRERLAFRDILRADAEVAARYAALKSRLATLHRRDREAYTDAKGPFIEEVLRRAVVDPNVTVRTEAPTDAAAIHAVLAAAFPTDAEARLVRALRASGKLSVSLVAEVDGAIVGHVAFSPVATADGAAGTGLAPVAVLASHRRRGIAARLIEAGLAKSRAEGAGWAVVLGEPAYYTRFGFRPAGACGLSDEYGGGPAFQAIELIGGRLPSGAGLVRYAIEFAAFGQD